MVSGAGRASVRPAVCRLPGVAVAALAFLACALLTAGVLLASPTGQAAAADAAGVVETYRVDVDAVGNVSSVDTLVYDRAFFDAQGATFEEYPFLLSRRYRAMEQVAEIQDFRADLDKANAKVTLTFREAGRAYNMGDHWIMYGFGSRPSKIAGREVVIEEETTENSDFTLWQDLAFKTTTYVTFPEGSANVRWDEEESALVWAIPSQEAAYAADQRNLLQSNQAVFIPVFAVLMAGSLGLAVVTLTRGRRGSAVAAAATVPATTNSGAPAEPADSSAANQTPPSPR